MTTQSQLQAAKFFAAAWESFCNDPAQALQELMENTPLCEYHILTQEDIDGGDYIGFEENEEVLVLSTMGKSVVANAEGEADE